MDNLIYISSPFFEKHLTFLSKQRYNKEVEVLSDTDNTTITKLAKKTRKCNMKDRKCDILLTHSDGSKHKKVRDLGSKVKSKFKKKNYWTGSNLKDITAIPSIVRRTLYNISNIIGNKGVLGDILGDKPYLPKTITLRFSDTLENDLGKIWKTNKFGKTNPVILKPSIGQEQRGIGVCSTIDEATKHIVNVLGTYPKYLDWEIQQYIYKPLCIKGEVLFPSLKKNVKIPLKESGGENRVLTSKGFYKCHIRAYGLIVYMKDTEEYKIYVYRRYKFNSAREPYPENLLNDDLDNVDLTNPWPHKSGGTEGGGMPFDFQELVEHLEDNKLMDCMVPKISKRDLNTNIKQQVNKIMLEVIKTAIKKGGCCTPTKDSIDTALAVYHPIGADLLIDHMKKVWFIEANPGVGFSLIPDNIVTIYKKEDNINNTLNGMNNFNTRLYNLLKSASKQNDLGNIKGFGGISERYFYLYQVIIKLDTKYHNIDTFRKVLEDKKETEILQYKITKLVKNRCKFISDKDIEIIRDTKIKLGFNKNIGKDYLEYIRNCRFFWRHTFLDRIMKITIDKIVNTKFKHRYQSKIKTSLFYDSDFDLLNTFD